MKRIFISLMALIVVTGIWAESVKEVLVDRQLRSISF